MIENYIKQFLTNKKGISIEALEKILKEKKNQKYSKIPSTKSNLFKLNSKTVFLKSALLKYKNEFLKELDDYLVAKVINKNLKTNLINYYTYTIPDILFTEWIEINLDKKILVFELLFNTLVKPKRIKDRIKIFLNDLSDIYAILVINSSLAIKYYENNFNMTMHFIKKIEKLEATLKDFFFTLFTHPEKIKSNLEYYETNLTNIKNKIEDIFNKIFSNTRKYSTILIKRIINNDFKDFDFLKLLTRFNFSSYYDWLNFLIEEQSEPHNNLFKDLGI